jgi:hypothetical protein
MTDDEDNLGVDMEGHAAEEGGEDDADDNAAAAPAAVKSSNRPLRVKRMKWTFELPKAGIKRKWKPVLRCLAALGFYYHKPRRWGAVEPQAFHNWPLIYSALEAVGVLDPDEATSMARCLQAEAAYSALNRVDSLPDPDASTTTAKSFQGCGDNLFIWGILEWPWCVETRRF